MWYVCLSAEPCGDPLHLSAFGLMHWQPGVTVPHSHHAAAHYTRV